MRKESPKGKGRKNNQFTMATNDLLHGLAEARASGREVIVYLLLTRYHNDKTHPDYCFLNAQYASVVLGIRKDGVSDALGGLCKKWFDVTPDGELVTVLERVELPHRGLSTVYRDNLYRRILEGTYPHPQDISDDGNAAAKGAGNDVPNAAAKGAGNDVPNAAAKGAGNDVPNASKRYGISTPNETEERCGNQGGLGRDLPFPEQNGLVKEGEAVMSNARGNQPLCTECTSSMVDVVTDEVVPVDVYGGVPEYRGRCEPDFDFSTPSFDNVPTCDTPVSVYEREVLSELFYGCATAPNSFPTDVWGE